MEKINWDEWEECTQVDYDEDESTDAKDTMFIRHGMTNLYFKRKAKTVFEDGDHQIMIEENQIIINDDHEIIYLVGEKIKLAFDAVDEYRRRWGKY